MKASFLILKRFTITLATLALGALTLTAQTNPLAESKRVTRGSGTERSIHSFVIPLSEQKGVALDSMGNNAAKFGNVSNSQLPWFMRMQKSTNYHIDFDAATSVYSFSVPFENPIVAYGSQGGGTPLYVNQPYQFGVGTGGMIPEQFFSAQDIRISAYSRSGFNGGTVNVLPVSTYTYHIPRKDTADWTQFSADGFEAKFVLPLLENGTSVLETTIKYVDGTTPSKWGDIFDSPLFITHKAQSDNYFFKVEVLGIWVFNGTYYYLAINPNDGSGVYSCDYTIDFEQRPPWRSTFIHSPQLEGTPLPSTYEGKSPDELLAVKTPVTFTPSLSPSACLTIDQSPELRTHPILDRFVSDMANDPIALTNYVFNEIQVTDAIAYNENGDLTEKSINLGGMTRGALGVFQEGQGSPREICSLLVYLMRKAGYPAVYMEPERNKLQMLDIAMTRILKFQVKGALDNYGVPYPAADLANPRLIPVNYPWVAVYVPDPDIPTQSKWIHIFPWIKDTEIIEGLDLYQYLPAGFNSGLKWVNKYLYGDTSIMSLVKDGDDTAGFLFPKYVEKVLKESNPAISFSDIGSKIKNRRNYRIKWDDFPMPFKLTGSPNTVESFKNKVNIFDTFSVKVYSKSNPTKSLSTGDMRLLDLHGRKFLIRHEKTGANLHNLILSLAPYRPGVSGQGVFTLNDPDLLQKQVLTLALDSTDDDLGVDFRMRRQNNIPLSSVGSNIDHWQQYLGYTGTLEFAQNARPLRKGDTAAICTSVGNVTQKMLAPYAEEFWLMQRQLQQNPNATIDPDISQGTSAYLMGMAYFEKENRFRELIQGLHKINNVTFLAYGLSKVSAKRVGGVLPNQGDLELNQASVDMISLNAAYASNKSLNADIGKTFGIVTDDFFPLFTAASSSLEHQIINSYYKDSTAISTVKLLQIAQSGSPGIVALTKSNYISQGNTNYTVDGVTKSLSQWDPYIWDSILKTFDGSVAGSMPDYAKAFITPGPVSSSTGAYKGVGAAIFGNLSSGALISSNLSTINGGFGSFFSAPLYSPPILPKLNLDLNPFGGYSLTYSNPTPAAPVLAPFNPTPINYTNYFNYALDNSYNYTAFQNSWTSSLSSTFNTSPTYSNVLTNVFQKGSLYTSPLVSTVQVPTTSGASWFKSMSDSFSGTLSNLNEGLKDPVNALTGEFYLDHVDLKLNGPMPLEIRRNYSSQNLADNDFGYGWKMNYSSYLGFNSDESLIYAADPEGSVIAYRRQTDPNLWIPTVADNPRLSNLNHEKTQANALLATLVKSTSGSDTLYTLTTSNGMKRIFKVRSFPISGLDRSRPYLDQWLDSQGNSYSFIYGLDVNATDYGKLQKIKSSNGTFIGFYYDTFGHVTESYTSDGRRLYYRYSVFGDLTEVTLPDASTISYEYSTESTTVNSVIEVSSTHLLSREVKPDGRILENTYDSQRRVTQQKATVGLDKVPVVNATFDYSVAGKTTLKDAYNRATIYEYADGKITKITDPLNQVTTSEWYGAGDTTLGAYPRSIKKTIDNRGLITEFKYDSKGNLIERKITGDVTGDSVSDTATTSMTYTSLNLLESVTDPAGNKTLYFYTNSLYPYLPTRIEKKASDNTSISISENVYTDATLGPVFAKGLLQRVTKASLTADEAVTEWTYNENGFPKTQTRFSGGSDPNIVLNFTYNLRGELVEQTDAAGRKTTYAYDAMGRRVWTEAKDATGKYVGWQYDYFNGNGEVEWSDGSRYNPEDYIWKKYDGAGRPLEEIRWRSLANTSGTGVVAPLGDDLYATTFYVHNLFGDLLEVKDARRNSTVMTYDDIGQMLTRKRYDGYASSGGLLKSTESFTYEPGGQVLTQTNPLGGITKRFYTADGKPRRQENPDGTVQEWRYQLDGRLQKEILSNGSYAEMGYNDATRTVTRTLKNSSNAVLSTEISVFDRRGNLVSKTDAESKVFTKVYDDLDRVKTETGPASSGNSSQVTVGYSYDNTGSVVTVTNNLLEKTIATSDQIGRILKSDTYSASNSLVKTTSYTYSDDHQSSTVTEGSGTTSISTQTWTDTFGKPVITKFADGTYRLQTYDIGGLLLTSRDELGQISKFTYDGLGRQVTSVTPDNATTTLLYDEAGNLKERQMPGGLTHKLSYDNAGRQLTEVLQSGASTTRSYGYSYYTTGKDIGRLQTVTDPRGIQHTRTYDDFGRVLNLACTGSQNASTSYQYDRRNLVTQISQTSDLSPATVLNRTYNAYGKIDTESVTVGATLISTSAQTWDSAARRTGLQNAGKSFGFQFRADGNLTQTSFGSQNYNSDFDNKGLLLSRITPYNSEIIDLRDARGRIKNQHLTVGGSNLFSETLAWRDDSTVLSYDNQRTGLYADSRGYSYNSRGQLKTESFAPVAAQTASYTYDFDFGAATLGVRTQATLTGLAFGSWNVPVGQVNAFGRITQETITGGNRLIPMSGNALGAQKVQLTLDGAVLNSQTYLGSQGNGDWSIQQEVAPGSHTLEAKAIHPSGFTDTKTTAFTVASVNDTATELYDASGNITTRTWSGGKVQTLTWDALGRLIKATERNTQNNGMDWTAVYDGLGRRVQTTYTPVTNNISGVAATTKSFFDPQVEFLEIAVEVQGQRFWKIHGVDLNGVYGGLNGIGGLQAVVKDSDSSTVGVVNDFYGNVVATISGTTLTWNPTKVTGYGPIPGTPLTVLEKMSSIPSSVDIAQAYAWRSRRLDGTGFTNLGARHYEYQSGRFLSPDPLGHASSMSLYDYANGDPVNRVDADGRFGKGAYQGGKDLVTGTGQLLWNVGGSIGYGATSAFNQDYANEVYGNQWNGLKGTGQGLYSLGSSLANGNFGEVGTALTGGEGRSGAFRAGYAATTIASIMYGGELGNLGKVGRVGEIGEIGAQAGSLATRAASTLDPAAIRFSQASVNGVEEIAASMRANGWQGAPIDVVRMSDGALTTFDNTRVLAARRAGIDVQAVVREASEAFPAERWTPKNGVQPSTWEDAVQARIQQQNRLYKETYPNGSTITGSVE